MNGRIGHIEFGLRGDNALFTTPESKYNGMPVSYQVPTFGSIRGIAGDIYRHKKPFNFDWSIKKIRVMNRISFDSMSFSFKCGDNQLLIPHTYLKDVSYQVSAEIVFADGKTVWSDKEHENAAVKAEKIFQENIFSPFKHLCFGRSECEAYANLNSFGCGEGFYDNVPEYDLGIMFVQFEYLDDNPYGKRKAYFAHMIMKNGVITLPEKKDCFSLDFN